MEIHWNPIASADITLARIYIADYNPDAAEEVAGAILLSVDRLAAYPHLWTATSWTDIRQLKVPRRSYIIQYRIDGETVEILRVLHEAQRRSGIV
jgi:toxin ParE1/3/4